MNIDDTLIDDIRFFAFVVANGTVASDLFTQDDADYRPHLVEFGSELEMLFVVFLRNLQRGRSPDQARHRAALWLKSYVDSSFSPDPPLDEWETRL
jgi:hypothetical protein